MEVERVPSVLKWVANVVSIAYGGSVVVDGDDPSRWLTPADSVAPRWVARLTVATPLVIVITVLAGLPWPIVGIVAGVLLLPLIASRVVSLRRR
jgi:hypothetical protein